MLDISNILFWVVSGLVYYHVAYKALYENERFHVENKKEEKQVSDSEEQFARNELRIKKMQDQIDDLLEHERIFDILITKLDERVRALEPLPDVKPTNCVEYVEYDPY
jgi:hypothetical protein